jgi:hypothetical protein
MPPSSCTHSPPLLRRSHNIAVWCADITNQKSAEDNAQEALTSLARSGGDCNWRSWGGSRPTPLTGKEVGDHQRGSVPTQKQCFRAYHQVKGRGFSERHNPFSRSPLDPINRRKAGPAPPLPFSPSPTSQIRWCCAASGQVRTSVHWTAGGLRMHIRWYDYSPPFWVQSSSSSKVRAEKTLRGGAETGPPSSLFSPSSCASGEQRGINSAYTI